MSWRFYGRCAKFAAHRAPIEQGGNECALILHSYAPCAMEVSGETPDEQTCPVIARAANYVGQLPTDLTVADRAERWLRSKGAGQWFISYACIRFELLHDGLGVRAIRCGLCGQISYNPNDVKSRYCGNCHQFLEDPMDPSPRSA